MDVAVPAFMFARVPTTWNIQTLKAFKNTIYYIYYCILGWEVTRLHIQIKPKATHVVGKGPRLFLNISLKLKHDGSRDVVSFRR